MQVIDCLALKKNQVIWSE